MITFADLFAISIYHGYIPQILIAEGLFLWKLRKKKNFILRLIIALPICIVLSIALPNIIAHYVSGLFSITIFVLSLLLCITLFDNRISDILFCCITAQFVQNLSYHTENLIRLGVFGDVDIGLFGAFILSACNMLVIYAICYAIFIRRMKAGEDVKVGNVYVFPMAVINVLFIYIIQYSFQYYEIDRIWITHLPFVICCIFGLCMQYGFYAYSDEQEENRQLEYFLMQEHKQYEMTRRNIDLLNMKAHDLKHHINRFHALSGYDEEELKEISTVVEEYEKTIDCGNKTLDVILTESQYECKKNHIALSLMVQGEELTFVHTPDLVSIFYNLLENAIDHERKIENEAQRCVALRVYRRGGFIVIHVENYCNVLPIFENGLPVTNKENKEYHGFGLRSVKYVAEKYGGTMSVGAEGDLFIVNILLPVVSQAG